MQSWKIGKLKAKVTAERAKLEKAVADEAKGGGGGGAGEASRTVRRKLLDEAGDRECLVYIRLQLVLRLTVDLEQQDRAAQAAGRGR